LALKRRRTGKPKARKKKATSIGRIRTKIFSAVREMYTEVTTNPKKGFHFPSGKDAALYLGYSQSELMSIPETAYESFAGRRSP
jgi:hypothetical protein